MRSESNHQAAPYVTPDETGRTIVAAPARMQTITIDDKYWAGLPAIPLRLRGRPELPEARAGVTQPSFIPKNGTV